MIQFLRPRKAKRQVELIEQDLHPDTLLPGTLLDRSARRVSDALDDLRDDERRLEGQLAEFTEELRQTRIALAAFEAAGGIIAGGQQPATIAADPDKVGRLVPRGRGAMAAVAAAETVVDGHGRVLKSRNAETPA